MRHIFPLFAALSCGCVIDNALSKYEEPAGGVDTGPTPPRPPAALPYDQCYWMDDIVRAEWNSGVNLTPNPDACLGLHHPVEHLDGHRITDGAAVGSDSSILPIDPATYAVLPVRAVLNRDPSSTWPQYFDPLTLDLTPGGTDGAWSAGFQDSLGNMGSIDALLLDQGFHPDVEVLDSSRAASTSASLGECDAYSPDLWLCVDVEHNEGSRRVPVESDCAAGSGTFQLVPRELADHDGDGALAGVYRAIQKSGSGVLTDAAWIQSASVVSSPGGTVRVIRANRPFHFGADDALVDASIVSRKVTTTGATFLSGDVSGGAPWVVSELPGSTQANFEVSLTWTCGSYTAAEEVTPEQGYTLTVAQLGCAASWPQKFVVRPVPTLAPTALQITTYGSIGTPVYFPLTSVNGERRFAGHAYPVDVSGALLSWSANGATVRLDSVSFGGASACSTGTYTLSPE